MSLIYETKRRTYNAQRGVSQNSGLTLVSSSGGYRACFECATRCSQVLGPTHLTSYEANGKWIHELLIPTEELHRAITKLSETYSVALVDTATGEKGTTFVLVWRIPSRTEAFATAGLLDTRAYEIDEKTGAVTFEVGAYQKAPAARENDSTTQTENLDDY